MFSNQHLTGGGTKNIISPLMLFGRVQPILYTSEVYHLILLIVWAKPCILSLAYRIQIEEAFNCLLVFAAAASVIIITLNKVWDKPTEKLVMLQNTKEQGQIIKLAFCYYEHQAVRTYGKVTSQLYSDIIRSLWEWEWFMYFLLHGCTKLKRRTFKFKIPFIYVAMVKFSSCNWLTI